MRRLISMPRIILRLSQRVAEGCQFIANYFHYRNNHSNHTEAAELARNTINTQSIRLH